MQEPKTFSQLGIKTSFQGFTGDQIKIAKVLNKEILICDYRIGPSRYPDKGNGKRLDMQIEMNGIKHIVWTSSTILQDQILQINKKDFPFKTTIMLENERLEFR